MADSFTQLTAPASLLGGARRSSSSRVAWFAGTSALLLCCALIAVSTQDGSSSRRVSLDETPGITDPNAVAPAITVADMTAAEAQVKADLAAQATNAAGSITGSVPTDEAEADAIIDGKDYVKNMAVDFSDVIGPHSDDAAEADKIIDTANRDNPDITGKAGATLYAAATDPTAPASAWMRGSIPNYRAESQYILSGIFGNYEKSLENKPTMSVVGGKVSARTVAYTIIDEAYKDKTSPDCTGSVDASGVHGVGKGTPPCTALLKFNKERVDPDKAVEEVVASTEGK